MSHFEININHNQIQNILCSKKEEFFNEEVKITILGIFCGLVLVNRVYEKQEAIEKIFKELKSEDEIKINHIMRNIVGPCYLIIEKNNYIEIFSSPSSYGFLYGNSENLFYLSSYEGLFYKNFVKLSQNYSFNEMMLLNSVVSHHSVIRAPFQGLIEGTKRCPPGCKIRIEKNISSIECFIMSDQSELKKTNIDENELQMIFQSVADLISKNLNDKNDNFKIAFSGGLDSSLMLALFHKQIIGQDAIYYKNYGTTQERRLAINIAKSLDQELNIINSKNKIDIEFIVNKGKSGLGTLLAEDYLKLGGVASPFKDDDNELNQLSITGQNADTLFHIDHFGPDNREMGLARLIYIVHFMRKRIYYAMDYYREKWWLIFYPFSVPKKRFNKSIYDLLKSTFSGVDEHVGPFEENTIKTPLTIDRLEFQNFRKNIFFDPLQEICIQKYGVNIKNSKINELDSNLVNHIVRSSRWFRSITNFAQQFGNISYYEKYNVLMFFSEGPISSRLLDYKLELKDNFIIKKFILKTFKSITGVSYNQHRMQAFFRGSIIHFYFDNILRVVEIMIRRIFRDFTFNVKKIKDIPSSDSNENFSLKKTLNLILDYQEEHNDILVKVSKDHKIRDYFEKCYHDIKFQNIDNFSRAQKMELCRFVNLHLLIDNL